jgi:hypothetical protein
MPSCTSPVIWTIRSSRRIRQPRSTGSSCSAAVACHVVGVWLLPAPGQLLQHAGLDSNRALLFTGIGADPTMAPVIAGTAHCSSFSWV